MKCIDRHPTRIVNLVYRLHRRLLSGVALHQIGALRCAVVLAAPCRDLAGGLGYHGIYSRLLARLLLGPDVAIRVPESSVPLRMRDGGLDRLDRRRVDAQDRVRRYARNVMPEWIEARVRALPRRRSGSRGA
jgi:hypothetical protein